MDKILLIVIGVVFLIFDIIIYKNYKGFKRDYIQSKGQNIPQSDKDYKKRMMLQYKVRFIIFTIGIFIIFVLSIVERG